MNLIQALRSRRMIRNNSFPEWSDSYVDIKIKHNDFFTSNHILDDNWEIQPEPEQKIEITKKQIQDIWYHSICYTQGIHKGLDVLLDKLGFKK